MSRLDELVSKDKTETQTLGVKMSKAQAEELKVIAKDLGLSRTKLVNEIFLAGLDELKSKRGNGAE
jgi:hypothetical protein